MAGPTASVAAPEVTPPRFNLVDAAEGVAGRWETGIAWPGDVCDPYGAATDLCSPDNFEADVDDVSCEDRAAEAFVIWEALPMSTFRGRTDEEIVKATVDRLRRFGPQQIEAEFWSGTATTANAWDNPFLTNGNATAVGGGTLPLFQAIAILQHELVSRSVQGFIHLPPFVASLYMSNGGQLLVDGNRLKDVFGNIWVPGAGYSLSSFTQAVLYATGAVLVDQGEIDVIVGTDQTNNTRVALASRMAVAAFDPCVHLSATADLCSLNCTA